MTLLPEAFLKVYCRGVSEGRKKSRFVSNRAGLFFAACGDFVASRLWDRRRFFGVMPTSLFSTAPATSVHFALPFFCDLLNGVTPPPPGPRTRNPREDIYLYLVHTTLASAWQKSGISGLIFYSGILLRRHITPLFSYLDLCTFMYNQPIIKRWTLSFYLLVTVLFSVLRPIIFAEIIIWRQSKDPEIWPIKAN